MPTTPSPLRYPGGKTKLFPLLREIIIANDLRKGVYAEPFAGGAGLGLELLLRGWIAELWINDLDPAIHAFWHASLNEPDKLCQRIESADITLDEWHRQKSILMQKTDKNPIDLAFAVLFLNRTNRSGILKGGVIGGLNQSGNYKMDCRFNKIGLCKKIKRISIHKPVIHLSNLDAIECLQQWDKNLPQKSIINIDPPYYKQGSHLYLNHYRPDDHALLAAVIKSLDQKWILTYDDVPEIESLYHEFSAHKADIGYSTQVKRRANELIFMSKHLIMPIETINKQPSPSFSIQKPCSLPN